MQRKAHLYVAWRENLTRLMMAGRQPAETPQGVAGSRRKGVCRLAEIAIALLAIAIVLQVVVLVRSFKSFHKDGDDSNDDRHDG